MYYKRLMIIMLEKIHILISIIAAFAVAFFCLITKTPLIKSIVGLIITIIAFYIIGVVIKVYFTKSISEKDENANETVVESLESDEELKNAENNIVAESIDES